MPESTLIDEHVSLQQCKRAVDALLTHATKFEEAKAESELLPGKEQNVWLVVNTKVMHPEKKLKPARIPVKYPIVDPRTSPVCLIVKDPQREYKDLIASQGIKFISRVVDIRHLKGKWKPFEARRLLLKENGLFLADERVVPLLPNLLGKIFFKAKKQPIPVCVTRKDLKGELERAISSTYFHQNQGTCTSVKIGTVSQKPAQVLTNLLTALPEVVKHIKGGWDNVQSFFLKTNSSAALPIWQCDLGTETGARWDGLVVSEKDEDEDMDDDEESDEDEDMKVDAPANAGAKAKAAAAAAAKEADPKVKGKKRVAEEVEAEKEKPKKKPKASTDEAAPAPAKAKGKAVAAPAAPAVEPALPTSEPAKKKRRKSTAEAEPAPAVAPAPASKPAVAAPTDTAPEKKKRRKSQAASEPPAVRSARKPAPLSPKRLLPLPPLLL
ncbi:ribosomal protein L1p/L10e family-domain-containing protein [Dichomitus squalens]|uniref:Ribosomal protein L1p/L10e family-domain-containing protein n=1 Tax=Dichomitus squalens TaxID=114155 RepID=A0A4Q9MDW3_9APHY|nr:ribosomal protein L1p/L10e family-domain-containing protein [Dichomitus squalens]